MRHYEVMVILDAGLEDDAIRAVLDRATQLLTTNGATVGKVDRWGKRRSEYLAMANVSTSRSLHDQGGWMSSGFGPLLI